MFKRKKKDVYSMTYEQLVNLTYKHRSAINEAKENLSEVTTALEQIGFNITFDVAFNKSDFNVVSRAVI